MTRQEKIEAKLEELFKNTNLSDFDFTGQEDPNSLFDYLQTQISESQFIYYSNAMTYLSENDASLKDSLALAADYGYTLENLDSEVLATLLQQDNLSGELARLKSEIEEIYEEAEEEEEENKE